MSENNLRKLSHLKYKYNILLYERVHFSLFRARQRFFEVVIRLGDKAGDKAGRILLVLCSRTSSIDARNAYGFS